MYWRFLSSTRIERLAGQALRNNSTFIALNKRDFKELGRYQRSPALSDVLETITQWCSKPPKGFEKFFKEKPGSGSKPTKSTTKEAPKEAKKSQPKPDAKAELQDFFKLGQRGGSKGGSGGGGAGMGGFGCRETKTCLYGWSRNSRSSGYDLHEPNELQVCYW